MDLDTTLSCLRCQPDPAGSIAGVPAPGRIPGRRIGRWRSAAATSSSTAAVAAGDGRVPLLALPARRMGDRAAQDARRRYLHRRQLRVLEPPRGRRRGVRLERPSVTCAASSHAGAACRPVLLPATRPVGLHGETRNGSFPTGCSAPATLRCNDRRLPAARGALLPARSARSCAA